MKGKEKTPSPLLIRQIEEEPKIVKHVLEWRNRKNELIQALVLQKL